MEDSLLRTYLYSRLADRDVAYNPVEPAPFDLVDLTRDVTNSTRIYHRRTECVREALEGANLIVTDSPSLADQVRRVLPKAATVALPFGALAAPIVPAPAGDRMVVGLFNHNGDVELNNAYRLKLLKSLDRELLVYGRALEGLEAEAEENIEAFAARCDVLLLPSLPGAFNSTTLPLAVMAARGVAVLADNAPGYYSLSPATGVQIMPPEPAAWRDMLDRLESQPAKLRTMQERNRAFAKRVNQESWQRGITLITQWSAVRPLVEGGCGCQKKKNQAPPNPALSEVEGPQSQPNTEKEL